MLVAINSVIKDCALVSQRLRRAPWEIAALTIERLAQDYARFFAIEPWVSLILGRSQPQ